MENKVTIEVEISEKNNQKILDFCNLNNIDLKTYLGEALMKGFNFDRFGDLNKHTDKTEPEIKEIFKQPLVQEVKKMENSEGFTIVYENGESTDVLWKEIVQQPIEFPMLLDLEPEKNNSMTEQKQEQQIEKTPKRNRRQIQSK